MEENIIMRKRNAFTLIELLIVVAIIAILAAIAVPNFLEAQVRAKVSRAKADMRSLATAIEAYAVDDNKYPYTKEIPYPLYLEERYKLLTTPIAYITSIPLDPFGTGKPGVPIKDGDGWLLNVYGQKWEPGQIVLYAHFDFLCRDSVANFPSPPWDGLNSWDFILGTMNVGDPRSKAWYLSSAGPDRFEGACDPDCVGVAYDPTNGTVSHGDIQRFGP
jgi:type II secretion system protein G